MALPSKLGRRLLLGVFLGLAVYVGMAVWADASAIAEVFRALPLWVLPAVCALSLGNYLIRFWKWQRYCALLRIEVEPRTSFLIYLSGLTLSVTPGKMGEVFKSWLLRKVAGTRIHASAPIIVAERLTDLFGYLILVALGGLDTAPEYAWVFWAMLALCALLVVLVGSRRFAHLSVAVVARLPLVARLAPRVDGAFESTRILLAPREIILPTLISVAGWGCECAGFWIVANAIVPDSVPFLYAVFAYAFSAVAGAVLIIFPGGLGVTEFSLGKLVRLRYSKEVLGMLEEVARQKAAAAVILTRLCTLWFAVLVGFVATVLFTRRFGQVDETADDESATSAA